ncbi:MAG: hypothetical protein P1S60_15315, partial [Anaerolineae bacterium]|nr:hypothetical protein [Anaerolineae bacterium]
ALSFAAWAEPDDMALTLEEINQHIQIYVHELENAKVASSRENATRLGDILGRCLRLQLIVTAAGMEPEIFRSAYRAGAPERLTTYRDALGG